MTNGSGTKALVAENRVEEYKKLGFSVATEKKSEVPERKPAAKRKTTKKAE